MEEGGAGEVAPEEPPTQGGDLTVEMTQGSTTEATEVTTEETTTTESGQLETTEETSVPVEEAPAPPPAEEPAPQQVEETAPPEPTPQPPPMEDTMPQGPAEIPQENIKNKLNEIINDLDYQEPVEYDNTVKESDWHTWRPRGKYNIPKVEIKFDELKSESIPDIGIKEVPKPAPAPVPVQKVQEKVEPVEMVDQYAPQPSLMNGDLNSPCLDIPMGIPLLARVLPKEEGDGPRDSIPLERLFTPATDSGEITPRKKKAFASSAFYAPHHPTIEDQVSLAQRISTSLIDENNKMSRGQSMYMKRKKRSVKWIHQGEDGDWVAATGEDDEPMQIPHMEHKERSIHKIQTSMRSEHSEMQQHLQQVTVAGQPIHSPEINFKQGDLQSPTGKGAELFAKRKKRMDQFIVDESTVQKSSATISQEQQSSMMSTSYSQQSSSSKSSGGAQFLRSTCTAVQPTIDASVKGTPEGPDHHLPDLTQILTKPCEPPRLDPKSNSHLQRSMAPDKSVSPSTRFRSDDYQIGKNNYGQNEVVFNQFENKVKTQKNKFSQVPQISKESVSPVQNSCNLSSNQNVLLSQNAFALQTENNISCNTTSNNTFKSSMSNHTTLPFSNPSNVRNSPSEAKTLKSKYSNNESALNSVHVSKNNYVFNSNTKHEVTHNLPLLNSETKHLNLDNGNVNIETKNNSQTSLLHQNASLSTQFTNMSLASNSVLKETKCSTIDQISNLEIVNNGDISSMHYDNTHYDPIPNLKPGSPPIFLYTDGSEVRENGIHEENQEVSNSKEEETSPVDETGAVNRLSVPEPKTNNEHPSDLNFSLSSSDLPLSACQESVKASETKDQPLDVLSETVRSTPSPRPVRPNSLAVIPLSSLVECVKPCPDDSLSFPCSSAQPAVCVPSLTQPYVEIQTSFSLAPASKRRLKAVVENVSSPEETKTCMPAIINMNANGSWYENNQIKDFVNIQLEPSCDVPIVEQTSLTLTDNSTKPLCDSDITHNKNNYTDNLSKESIEVIKSEHIKSFCGEDNKTIVKVSSPDSNNTKINHKGSQMINKSTCHPSSTCNNTTNSDETISSIIANLEAQIIECNPELNINDKHNLTTDESSIQQSIININNEMCVALPTNESEVDIKLSSIDEDDDVASYISEMERSLCDTPIFINTIEVDDLKPPEFYRSVSRNSIQEEDDDPAEMIDVNNSKLFINNTNDYCIELPSKLEYNTTKKDVIHDNLNESTDIVQSKGLDTDNLHIDENKNDDNIVRVDIVNNQHSEDDNLPEVKLYQNIQSELNDKEIEIDKGNINNNNNGIEQCATVNDSLSVELDASPHTHTAEHTKELPSSLHTPQTTHPCIPSVTLMEGSRREPKHIRTSTHTEGAPVYTAEVKVVQRASLPPSTTFEIPEDMPHHSIIQEYDNVSKEEKRKSFNFAAKGWGTYNNFYTPITFSATS